MPPEDETRVHPCGPKGSYILWQIKARPTLQQAAAVEDTVGS